VGRPEVTMSALFSKLTVHQFEPKPKSDYADLKSYLEEEGMTPPEIMARTGLGLNELLYRLKQVGLKPLTVQELMKFPRHVAKLERAMPFHALNVDHQQLCQQQLKIHLTEYVVVFPLILFR
jgi:hypothetical protein